MKIEFEIPDGDKDFVLWLKDNCQTYVEYYYLKKLALEAPPARIRILRELIRAIKRALKGNVKCV